MRPGLRLGPALATLLSHWNRHRFQLATLIAGLAVATALWSGVQALNAQAKQSYTEAASRSTLAGLSRLVPTNGEVALADYVALRRAGWLVTPVIERPVDGGSRIVRLLGVDLLSLPPDIAPTGPGDDATDGFFAPPYRVFAHPDDAATLAARDLPPVPEDPAVPDGTALVDIAAIAPPSGGLTYLILLPDQREGLPPIADLVGTRLTLVAPQTEVDLARLTESFHLNLTAFGLLSFVVGLFIVHSTIGLAFEQRRAMFRTMRACGTSLADLTTALLAELVVLALVAGALGMILGYVVAAALIGDVAASLRGLYARSPRSVVPAAAAPPSPSSCAR
jgi:putative ABC transport system permease protein